MSEEDDDNDDTKYENTDCRCGLVVGSTIKVMMAWQTTIIKEIRRTCNNHDDDDETTRNSGAKTAK